MAQPGRKSAASLRVVQVDAALPKLEPPASLSGPEREVFRELIDACDRRHFRRSDMPLVTAYCRAVHLERWSAAQLGEDPESTRMLALWEKSGRALVALAAKLRLCPAARQHPRTAARMRAPSSGPAPWD
jgi:hypothetical protein